MLYVVYIVKEKYYISMSERERESMVYAFYICRTTRSDAVCVLATTTRARCSSWLHGTTYLLAKCFYVLVRFENIYQSRVSDALHTSHSGCTVNHTTDNDDDDDDDTDDYVMWLLYVFAFVVMSQRVLPLIICSTQKCWMEKWKWKETTLFGIPCWLLWIFSFELCHHHCYHLCNCDAFGVVQHDAIPCWHSCARRPKHIQTPFLAKIMWESIM